MKIKNKIIGVLILIVLFSAAIVCISQRMPYSVLAAESATQRECIVLPEWRICFSDSDHTAKLRSSQAGKRLTGRGKKIYDLLAVEIKKIAAAEKASTQFTIPVEDLADQLQYSQDELGVSLDSKEEQQKAMGRFMEREVITGEELHVVYNTLLVDFPYELYWYDKAADESFILSLDGVEIRNDSIQGKCLCVEDAVLTFGFLVDGYYGSEYRTNADRMEIAKKAAANAQKIVEEAAGMSDYRKLVYYREKICALTSYNAQAAQTKSPGNQNPWQLVYVFDEDSTTNAVCEGYAKAFQYLCDLTAFADEGIYSYIVTGTIAGDAGEGPHMWNIVHVGEYGNYLADVTNCDKGMIGEEDQLFLAASVYGNMSDGYRFKVSSKQVTYKYQEEMINIYSKEDLSLVMGQALKESDIHVHTWEETQTVDATCTFPGKRVVVCSVCGRAKVEELPAIGHAYEVTVIRSKDKNTCTIALACKNDSSHRLVQYEGDAITEHQIVELEVKELDGRWKYTLKMDVRDLTVGNVLWAYRLDPETGKCRIEDGRTKYMVREDGSIDVSLRENETYRLLNTAEAETVNQEILKTITPKKPSVVVEKGKSVKFYLSSGLDMENVKNIVYTSSNKAVVKVSPNGKITAKKAGTALVKAKVTLKNEMVRVVSMKIKVK